MNFHTEEKRALEREAVELFIPCYAALANKQYQLLSMQERPDALLQDGNGNQLGLEVAHLYYDALEAKMIFGRSDIIIHALESLAGIIAELNKLLKEKGETGRSYMRPYPISLLIRSASPIFTGENFISARDVIIVPQGVYHEIWLLARNEQTLEWTDLIQLG